jgi:hypothetical protein
MKKFIKKSIAVLLIITLMSGLFTCFATKYEKKYEDYGSYVLLGDSVASGWSDVVEKETRFVRVEGSYGAHVADDLGVDVYHPMACIGFRTVDMRYIFEDNYEADRFLFYSIDEEVMAEKIPEIRKAVAEAGIITLNVGGNDWGSYVGWHIYEEMDKFEEKNQKFMDMAYDYLINAGTEADTVESLIDLAALCGALPDIIKVLPQALVTGFRNFVANWNYVVEDIYALNPDVTLVVIGMFDNSVQDQETADKNEAALLKLSVGQLIVDYANKPMAEGAEKYGYTFIDPVGTVCEQNHPSAEGHRYIADLILDSLPDANFPYEDISTKAKEYKSIEYMFQHNIMDGISRTKFGYNEPITMKQLADATYNVSGVKDIVENSDDNATYLDVVSAAYKMVVIGNKDPRQQIKATALTMEMISNVNKCSLKKSITRAEAAVILKDYIDIM